jgi:hypothetical protein
MMNSMDDLVTWLRAQLDDDELTARAAADSMLWHGPVKAGEVWDSHLGFVYTEGQVPGVWDECLWKADTPGRYTREMSEHCAHHVARHDPARVLREVEAKRQIIDLVAGAYAGYSVLPRLALPYADRPGYREEWKP